MAKCPYCEEEVSFVLINEIEIRRTPDLNGPQGVTYSCPNCQKILSVQYDPFEK